MAQPKTTTLDPGFVQRVASGLLVPQGLDESREWFGPLRPMVPLVPDVQKPSVEGRQFDYPVGYNLHTQPKQGAADGVPFLALRALADGYDLLRLVIETRKDQLVKFAWTIKPRDPKAKADARCKELEEFLLFPDQEHTWEEWLRALIEDMLVIDAATIYPRRTRGGDMYSLELIDGGTIKRVLDAQGRTPLPPETAYVQVLKGIPAVHYTRDELIYRARNVRTNRVYGYGPVEQILSTVDIALRRQESQRSYYTDGSTPDLLLSVPREWNADQIREFKMWWDSVLSGNVQSRRGTMFVPEGVTPVNTKEQVLKDQYDEWLARLVCYAFSVSPQALMAMMNRATAQTAQETAKEEGLHPLLSWVKNTINVALWSLWGYRDLTFDWDMETEVEPLEQAQIDEIHVRAKIRTPDEVRARLGDDPLTDEEREKHWPTLPAITEPVGNAPPKPGEKKPKPALATDKFDGVYGLEKKKRPSLASTATAS